MAYYNSIQNLPTPGTTLTSAVVTRNVVPGFEGKPAYIGHVTLTFDNGYSCVAHLDYSSTAVDPTDLESYQITRANIRWR